MFVRSERLFLRPGWPEDRSELLGNGADRHLMRHLAPVPWGHAPGPAREPAAPSRHARCPFFLVTLPGAQGSSLIGVVGIGRQGAADGDGQPELACWIAPDFRRRGYATEAARAVLRLAVTLGHTRLLAHRFLDDPASGHLLRKLGFAPNGRTGPRWSPALGAHVEALLYETSLAPASDGDGGEPAERHAA